MRNFDFGTNVRTLNSIRILVVSIIVNNNKRNGKKFQVPTNNYCVLQ